MTRVTQLQQSQWKVASPEDQKEFVAEVTEEEDPNSVCGLEISLKSVPEDVDIKLITGEQEEEEEEEEGVEGEVVEKEETGNLNAGSLI